jgi:uncharacterized membrane protein
MDFETIILVLIGTLTGLIAGLFFTFTVAVNSALARFKDAEFVQAWQAINQDILNPIFLLTFMAPVILLPILTFLHKGEAGFAPLLMASVVYILGSFVITRGGNIPLNDKLDKFSLTATSSGAISEARTQYEKPWYRLNTIRMFMSILATVLIFVACLIR